MTILQLIEILVEMLEINQVILDIPGDDVTIKTANMQSNYGCLVLTPGGNPRDIDQVIYDLKTRDPDEIIVFSDKNGCYYPVTPIFTIEGDVWITPIDDF